MSAVFAPILRRICPPVSPPTVPLATIGPDPGCHPLCQVCEGATLVYNGHTDEYEDCQRCHHTGVLPGFDLHAPHRMRLVDAVNGTAVEECRCCGHIALRVATDADLAKLSDTDADLEQRQRREVEIAPETPRHDEPIAYTQKGLEWVVERMRVEEQV